MVLHLVLLVSATQNRRSTPRSDATVNVATL